MTNTAALIPYALVTVEAGAEWVGAVSTVQASDDDWLTCDIPAAGASERVYLIDFRVPSSVDNDATVNGVEVRVERSQAGGGVIVDNFIKLMVAGAFVGDSQPPQTWPWVDTTQTFGSSTSIWGVASLTGAQVKAVNFGVGFSVVQNGPGGGASAFIDLVTLTVYYTNPGGDTVKGSGRIRARSGFVDKRRPRE